MEATPPPADVTDAMIVIVPREYPLVLLTIMLMNLLLLYTQLFVGGKSRGESFNKKHMDIFAAEHANANVALNTAGYPDCGEGRYSDKLEYKDWYNYASNVRSAANLIEHFPFIIGTLAIGGLFLPITATAVGFIQFFARVTYIIGYQRGGPKGRIVGALAGHLSIVLFSLVAFLAAISAFFVWKPNKYI